MLNAPKGHAETGQPPIYDNGGKGPGYYPRTAPRHAMGTRSAPGGWSMVGERGPELMNLKSGATVLNARDTMSAMGGGITINIGVAGDPVSTGREIDRVLRQYYRRSGQVTAR